MKMIKMMVMLAAFAMAAPISAEAPEMMLHLLIPPPLHLPQLRKLHRACVRAATMRMATALFR